MIWLALALAAPLLVYVSVELWRRPERQFTLYSSAARWGDALPSARVLARRPARAHVRGRRQMNLGTILARLEEWDEAREVLEVARATQAGAGDPYESLTRSTLALLELRRGEVAKARDHARAIEAGAEELRPKARLITAAALLVEGNAAAVKDLLGPSRPELVSSKRPSDMALLAVLAAAAPDPELEAIVKERMPLAQRKELGGQLPLLARVLGV
ncbi:MAG TPA: tetratricopeptide repeat protein [Planctomycetota bacterium]|nr:tetratricopeptide repeat protein [Planctomycetota bacterium]